MEDHLKPQILEVLLTMYWKFDVRKFALHQLPPFLRKKGIYALLKSIMIGVDWVFGLFTSHRETVVQQLNHNGSTISLEAFLNEKFSLNGEIYLTDFLNDNVYLYVAGETAEDVYMGYKDEADLLILSSESPDTVSGGFTVMIPSGLGSEENLAIIRKWVDYYRASGTKYKIETYG